MQRNSQELIAPAKLTLSLRITGVRDDGYHLIDAEMVTLSLHDTVTISELTDDDLVAMPAGFVISANGKFASGMPLDESNLIAKSLKLSGRQARVHVTKNVPHGGGLGGGSADAAAVLRWANFTNLVAASKLGADIPFCMVGGHARVQGIGEVITPLPVTARDFTLIIPPIHVSTPDVYKTWDQLGGPRAHGPNDLEPAACVVEPKLVRWRDKIAEITGQIPTLAGSGATWFINGKMPELVAAFPDARVIVTSTQ